jgi:hypothetical protein
MSDTVSAQYPFRSEETDEVRYFDFEKMMTADCMGVIQYRGKPWKRARDLEPQVQSRKDRYRNDRPEIVSDALGFTQTQLAHFEEDRKKHQFHGIEFREDPDVPRFYQVKCSSPEAFDRYAKHRGFFNKSGKNGGGACLTEADFESAKELVSRAK